MPKRPDTIETVILALELLRRIPRTGRISAPTLHAHLADAGIERDLRTIQRQLEMLADHFDIERDERSKPYGYRWKANAKGLSLPMLSPQESLLLTLAEKQLGNQLPAGLMQSMEGYFSQARANLGQSVPARREREWISKIRVVSETQPLIPPKILPGVFEAVSNALYRNQYLDLNYKNMAGKKTTAKVMPLGLAQQGPRLYLVCRFDGFENERSLAMHRILSAEMSTLSFERPKDFDLQKYDDDGRFGFGDGKRVKLRFQIKKSVGRQLLESPLSTDQTAKELDDWLEISATVVDTLQLQWWLNGFGDRVKNIRRTAPNSAPT